MSNVKKNQPTKTTLTTPSNIPNRATNLLRATTPTEERITSNSTCKKRDFSEIDDVNDKSPSQILKTRELRPTKKTRYLRDLPGTFLFYARSIVENLNSSAFRTPTTWFLRENATNSMLRTFTERHSILRVCTLLSRKPSRIFEVRREVTSRNSAALQTPSSTLGTSPIIIDNYSPHGTTTSALREQKKRTTTPQLNIWSPRFQATSSTERFRPSVENFVLLS